MIDIMADFLMKVEERPKSRMVAESLSRTYLLDRAMESIADSLKKEKEKK